MTPSQIKEVYRLFWMVKGHLKTEDHIIMECYDGYFKRMWYNEEGYTHEEGFEAALKAKQTKKFRK